MKSTVRYLALFLCGILLLGLCACGKKDPQTPTGTTAGGNSTTPSTDAPTEETTQGEEKPGVPSELDFDNAEFRILARSDAYYYNTELWIAEDAIKSEADSAVYGRYKKIEEDFNVTFRIETKSESEVSKWMNVTSMGASLKNTFHLVAQHGRYSNTYAL